MKEREVLRGADIIAMTTSGRAKYESLLDNIKFPIVLVEEAAEVFEAHIITSISSQTEHMILVGDHQQLRPNPAVYQLSHNYNLSISLFERLINNNIPYVTLGVQRRMRKEIADLLIYIYPDLKSHERVLEYPNVKGTYQNLFFMDHSYNEESNG